MADTNDALSIIIGAISKLASFIYSIQWSWLLSKLTRLISIPLNLAWVPISYISEVLAVIFAPLIYLISLTSAILSWILSFLSSLKPLYSFFSAAAGVGIIAGVTIGITSSLLTSYMGIQDDEADFEEYRLAQQQKDREQQLFKRAYAAALRSGNSKLLADGESSSDAEWRQWTDSPSTSRRRKPSGLLSQTIHEEDDDSEV